MLKGTTIHIYPFLHIQYINRHGGPGRVNRNGPRMASEHYLDQIKNEFVWTTGICVWY